MPAVDAAEFHAKVYAITRLVPHGSVTTYGHVARLAGSPSHSRMVGAALKLLGVGVGVSGAAGDAHAHAPAHAHAQTGIDDIPDDALGGDDGAAGAGAAVPWHRIINSSGAISPRGDGGLGAARQVALLRAEGVDVAEGAGAGVSADTGGSGSGSYRVSLARYGWFPESVEAQLEGVGW